MTSIFGDKLEFSLPIKAELWVDGIIAGLLKTDDPLVWKSFESKLPLIAEASPNSFLNALEKHLPAENSPIKALFDEDPGLITGYNYHTGLLWALESLAWFPQYLSRVSLILSNLSEIDPGGNLLNRPINSLSEIFKPWHYQTLATFEERIQILKLISERYKEIAWTILTRMLPDSHGIGNFTHKTRWRMFDLVTEKSITYKEIYKTHSTVVELLISSFDFTETKLSKLIEESVNLLPNDRDKVLLFVEKVVSEVKQVNYDAWSALRRILYMHRSHPDANWAIEESELIRFQKIYDLLTPSNEIDREIWMFDEHWPNFVEGYKHEKDSHSKQAKFILDKRIDGLKNIYGKHGIDKIIELGFAVKEKWIYGDTLAHILNDDDEIIKFCELSIKYQGNEESMRLVKGFISRVSFLYDLSWVIEFSKKLKVSGFSNSNIGYLFATLNQTKNLWDFIDSNDKEMQKEYWKNCFVNFYGMAPDEKVYGLRRLIEYKRFISAVTECNHCKEDVPSELMVEILKRGEMEKADEKTQLHGYEISQLFETIDERNDTEPSTLIELEWLYLPILASYGNSRKPKTLHEELSKNPEFMMEVLRCIYKPGDESKIEEQVKGLTSEQVQNRARQADELLRSWKKIPGVDGSGKIDIEFLNDWISRLRALAIDYGNINAADINIGQVLAHYPQKTDKVWPPYEICEVIENLKSECVNRNFSSAVFNKDSFTTRGPFDGGDIERAKAKHFYKIAEEHRNTFPLVSSIFEGIAKGYDADAIRMDEHAEKDRLDY